MSAAVVLVHGLGGAAAEWSAVADALRAEGREVRVPELPGHGARRAEAFELETALAAVRAACREAREAGGSRGAGPLLAGRALGGHLAIQVAATTPEDAPRGVLAAGIGTETLGWLVDSYRVAGAVAGLLPDRGEAVNRLAAETFSAPTGGSAQAAEVVAGLRPQALDAVHALDTRAALRRIEVPVVVANGAKDRFRLQEGALRRAIRRGRLERIRGAALGDAIAGPEALLPLLPHLRSLLGEPA
ncbi:alpha/beta fold hydrolase [Homoserinibacter sp. YIM 151385]|uniref:alpha/beta fold hydrolase n=1 Tax=Homoserinibacter sp. YIM 151385 TaxID=2985506 RepID=UPI0022F08470|nr:alpha/beta fold hydrolase [Homoserinibacter sp. YIM 151385]WBU38943.1 alpha/beta fold hydrolase [Homoserinibacter sp. YIM 151385]